MLQEERFRRKLRRKYSTAYDKALRRRRRRMYLAAGCAALLTVAIAAGWLMIVAKDTGGRTAFDIPDYSGEIAIEINGNRPFFSRDEMTAEPFEQYSPLDSLGRCGAAFACVGKETMPTEARGGIGMIQPTGWHTVRYDDLIKDKYLYNRCHLIAYALSSENDNELNLITGTRYFNLSGMLPYENAVADYIDKSGNHVLYRVTPVFRGDDLVATGVLMEAESVEDHGKGLMFNVFVYNVQPGIRIDYRTGESERS